MNRKGVIQGSVDIFFGVLLFIAIVIFSILIFFSVSGIKNGAVLKEVSWEAGYTAHSLVYYPVSNDLSLSDYLTTQEADEDFLKELFEDKELIWTKNQDDENVYIARIALFQNGEVKYLQRDAEYSRSSSGNLRNYEVSRRQGTNFNEDSLEAGYASGGAELIRSALYAQGFIPGVIVLPGEYEGLIVVVFDDYQ